MIKNRKKCRRDGGGRQTKLESVSVYRSVLNYLVSFGIRFALGQPVPYVSVKHTHTHTTNLYVCVSVCVCLVAATVACHVFNRLENRVLKRK